jgi:hypothetical protein
MLDLYLLINIMAMGIATIVREKKPTMSFR